MGSRRFTRTKAVLVVLVAAALLGLIPSSSAPGQRAQAQVAGLGEPPAIDIASLSNVPEISWGVSGLDQPDTTNIPNVVWDAVQIGNRYYLAGAFTHVQEGQYKSPIWRPYLAAFDINTGAWDSSFAPNLNGPAFALEVSPNGTLLVGGEFTAVSGQPNTSGLVGLNASTGAIASGFTASVERPWTSDLAVVRDLEVVGNDLYIGGNFSHVRGDSQQNRTRVYKLARVNALTGNPDMGWKPQVAGGSVWDMSVDPGRGRVALSGWFSSVNGWAATAQFTTVSTSNGNTVWLESLPRNSVNAPEMYTVEYANSKVWAGGSQHVTYVLNADTHAMLGYHTTGMLCDGLNGNNCGYISGGDTQVIVKAGNVMFVGCHCLVPYADGQFTHYNSYTQNRTGHAFAMAYNAESGALIDSFKPDLGSSEDGVWAIHTLTNGCLILAGQFNRGGYTAGSSFWVGNVARFCEATAQDPGLQTAAEEVRELE